MANTLLLARDWSGHLAEVISGATKDLLISSPYVTREGCEFILDNLSSSFKSTGTLRVLTNLTPVNICQGATDPKSLRLLTDNITHVETTHLPRLHAKVYLADTESAIVTSANLTLGGLRNNFEYGIALHERGAVKIIRSDIVSYSGLGARLSREQLGIYCEIADKVRVIYRRQINAASHSIRREFARAMRTAEDELVRCRLERGPMHTVFANTILYLLERFGRLPTTRLHTLVEEIHPDLCDNAVDRIIDGKRFGKKWKHAVRSAQQHLKSHGLIRLIGGEWERNLTHET